MRAVIAAALVVGGGSGEEEAWVFFSPDGPDPSGIFAQLGGRRVRSVLLVERYFGEGEPSPAFLAAVAAAGEVRVVDEEGLREAERLGIRELPAVAVLRGGRAHVASGTRIDLRELLKCGK